MIAKVIDRLENDEQRLFKLLNMLGRRKHFAVLITAATAFLIAAVISCCRTPVPAVHDEFSYLLAADTFAHGRLTNPTHPMWMHFESFHILHQPHYVSKYPPAQGLLLALGKATAGHPIVGAWIGVALAAAGICWMLQGWLASRWALLGGLLVAFHPAIQLTWGQSYWGGCMPLLGSALLFGGIPRLVQKPKVTDALLMSLGIVILANSRPFEGLLATIVAVGGFVGWLFVRKQVAIRELLLRVVAPSAVVFTVAAAVMGYYNFRLTGSPLKMIYSLHAATYDVSPLLLWNKPNPVPHYNHATMQEFYLGDAMTAYHSHRTLTSAIAYKGRRISTRVWAFYLGISLAIPLVTVRQWLGDRRTWYPTLGFALFLLAAASTIPWSLSHYYAPGAPMLFLVVVFALSNLRRSRGEKYFGGKLLFATVLLLHLGIFGGSVIAHLREPKTNWTWQRAGVQDKLERTPGRHLVIVRYGPNHNANGEWVYNEADIDSAKVVWAREMNPERNQRLMGYFHDRHVWSVFADTQQPKLIAERPSLLAD